MAVAQLGTTPDFLGQKWDVPWTELPSAMRTEIHEHLKVVGADLHLPYTPTLKQARAHLHPATGRRHPLFYGGAMGGAKSTYIAGEAIREARDVDGNRSLIGRFTLESLKGSTLDELLHWIDWGGPGHEFAWNKNEKSFTRRDNESEIRYGGVGSSKDVQNLGSRQYGSVFLDEATEVGRDVFEMLVTRCRLPAAEKVKRIKIRLTGNPWPGWIENDFIKRPKDGYYTIRAYVLDNPYIDPSYVEDMRSILPPARFKAWLQGSWDFEDQWNAVIPLLETQAMVDRTEPVDINDCSWGIDVGSTHDKTTVAQRAGLVFGILDEWVQLRTDEYGDAIIGLYNSRPIKPSRINVDIDGLGLGLRDYLVRAQLEGQLPMDPHLYICGVHAQSSAFMNQEADNPFRYGNIKAENAFKFREIVESGRGQLLPDPKIGGPDFETIADLCTPIWERKNAKIYIEDKRAVKSRLGHSPDRGDAILLTMYLGRQDDFESSEGPVDPRTGERLTDVPGFETYEQEMERLAKERHLSEGLDGIIGRWMGGKYER